MIAGDWARTYALLPQFLSVLLVGAMMTVIVTGGNSGIGEAIVRAGAAEGANVVIDFVEGATAAQELVEDIKRTGGSAMAVQLLYGTFNVWVDLVMAPWE